LNAGVAWLSQQFAGQDRKLRASQVGIGRLFLAIAERGVYFATYRGSFVAPGGAFEKGDIRAQKQRPRLLEVALLAMGWKT
jgi:hypothetical protein